MEIVKKVLKFLGFTVLIYAYTMLVQLIISFIALSFIQMNIERMFIFAGAVTVIADVIYTVKRVKKSKK